jgi:Transposase IS66 family
MYPRVFKHRPGVLHVECIGHLRRYVLETIKADEAEALPLLKDITELYNIEQQAGDLGHAQRGAFRHAKAKPLRKRLQRRFLRLQRMPLFGKLREAVTYATGRWRQYFQKWGNARSASLFFS